MADVKVQGVEDLRKLLLKEQTWVPPPSLGKFLTKVAAEHGFYPPKDLEHHRAALRQLGTVAASHLVAIANHACCVYRILLDGSMQDYLRYVELVISTSRYTDGYVEKSPRIRRNLESFVDVKTSRIVQHPDVEECVDVGAYSYMLWHQKFDG